MSYRLRISEKDVFGKAKYISSDNKSECAEFVRQATGAPHTTAWRKGTKVSDASPGEIVRGTAIATFDEKGKYPVDNLGKHAAIYLEHNAFRILVLDQWNDQGEVKERPIYFNRAKGTRRSNDANVFFVVE
jgi:hypothetical protein